MSMSPSGLRYQPGGLWGAVRQRTERALACGALQPIQTSQTFVEDQGVRFAVRIASNLARKDREREGEGRRVRPEGKPFNPFLPYDPELFVADLSATHVCLLNKFNVIDHHLLIVTRDFEDQELLLTPADFEAMCVCLAEQDGLAFYNGGAAAGASQRHKHLQLVPLPLAETEVVFPLEPRLRELPPPGRVATVPGLPFRHAWGSRDSARLKDPLAAARADHALYGSLLQAVGWPVSRETGPTRQAGPYNLLWARDWMLLVPRGQDCCDGVSINALGFAGSFFVRSQAELEAVRARGPMRVLEAVGASTVF